MSGFQCPYCSMVMSISPFTYVSQSPSFSFSNGEAYKKENGETVDPSTLRIAFYKCPNCGQISINALGIGKFGPFPLPNIILSTYLKIFVKIMKKHAPLLI